MKSIVLPTARIMARPFFRGICEYRAFVGRPGSLAAQSSLRKLPAVFSLALVIALFVYGFWPMPIAVDVGVVTRGPMVISIRDDGETQIKEKYIVSTPIGGSLLRLQLHPGDAVTRETLIAQIEPAAPPLLDARARAQAEARVRSAEAAERQASEAASHQREAMELARHEFDRARELVRSKSISPAEFDRAEHQQRIEEAELRSAVFATTVAAFELELAKAALIRFQEPSGEPTVFTIHAPIDGEVLRVFHEDGATVQPGTQLMEIGNPTEMEMKIDLLSTDAVRVPPNARVIVEDWGGSGPLEGRVRLVEPQAFLKVSALGVEEKRVNVIADFTTPFAKRESLGDGYRIEVRVVVREIEDALQVPAGALFRQNGTWAVYRVLDGRAQSSAVEAGESNGEQTQVLSGISAGDLVVLYPTDKVTDGVGITYASVAE